MRRKSITVSVKSPPLDCWKTLKLTTSTIRKTSTVEKRERERDEGGKCRKRRIKRRQEIMKKDERRKFTGMKESLQKIEKGKFKPKKEYKLI